MITTFMNDNTRVDSKSKNKVVDVHGEKADNIRMTPFNDGFMKNSARMSDQKSNKLSSRLKKSERSILKQSARHKDKNLALSVRFAAKQEADKNVLSPDDDGGEVNWDNDSEADIP
mmetsp:Transcript_38057/g.49974  ORF Transcript_38057/g.49974 Transcript_38057/m.49974 type:complete len:116 (-) Transcript_38057:334-681(-)|eukprot:CAMPEP_0185616234 /NCGR_PEP_ID=MMETSP0436-20130131/38855_1 /TAXON_ID=626734 ORGANISM="Favella taraikaensis, Strain Fe Narragansett Bay" /NCGR_SAMPLE_ID=MMETSP0436 /ASSEMBLY_ACC=CAM_ASM_000390 /LENGTH=115 /DNA_ID=CAMNT_0028252719 /DNA_START=114 /DNA_END=461 /DNA_ORIENTATION=-